MSTRVLHIRPSTDGSVAGEALRAAVDRVRAELGVPEEFPPDVTAAARHAAQHPRLPELDRTDLALVTIDPPGARDLDQALHIERDGAGYVVHYAIADVAAFVTPGDPVDLEANRRGQTLYGADSRIPLHPPEISEDAGSLLPDQVRPALLWTITLDAEGERTDARVERALVRSRAQLDYAQVQQQIDAGTAEELFVLLGAVGELRRAREVARGGVSLPLPEQEIAIDGEKWRLEFRSLHPVEDWNAQISLLTGMAAADMMIEAGVGLLRTLPPARDHDVTRLHRVARGLGLDWPTSMPYPEFIRSLDPSRPAHAAMVVASTRLLRGASYAGFDGALPEVAEHAALAAPYAHVTAPLRRLVDRYAGEICVALSAGAPVPTWVLERFDTLPETMRTSGQRANHYENVLVNLMEAAVLSTRVGETFHGVVVEVDEKDLGKGDLTLADPAVEARIDSSQPLPLGERVAARLVEADVTTRTVRFELD